jgi:hypothetical protein
MPLSREARCRVCESDLCVCRQCCFYDTGKAKHCAEPVADEVRDKERANFCGYFKLNPSAHASGDEAEAARQRLESMFGVAQGSSPGDGAPDADALSERRSREADDARSQLDKLFGLDED